MKAIKHKKKRYYNTSTIYLDLRPASSLKWKLRELYAKFSKNRLMVSILIAFLITTGVLLILYYSDMSLPDLSDNARYFFSATAQCIATLVALTMAIYALSFSKIPDYEILFEDKYPQIMDKYYEFKFSKRILLSAGIIILLLLLSIETVNGNELYLNILVVFNVFCITIFLSMFIFFTRDFLITSYKTKFFNDCHQILSESKDYDFLYEVTKKIDDFITNSEAEQYIQIRIDKKQISELPKSIIEGMGNFLKNEQSTGDFAFYKNFEEIIKIVSTNRNINVWSVSYEKIIPNFKEHVEKLLKQRADSNAYILHTLRIMVRMIDGLSRTQRIALAKLYTHALGEILHLINQHKGYQGYTNEVVNDTAKVYAICGLYNYDYLEEMMDIANLSTEQKINTLKLMIAEHKKLYDVAKNYEDYDAIIKQYNLDISADILKTSKSMRKIIRDRIDTL